MSKLSKITVDGDGLKGQTFEVELEGVDVFAGPNGAGKTTRLLAVTAGLRGLAESSTDSRREYVGDRPNATVELCFDGKPVYRRDLSKTRGKDVAAFDARADELAGPHLVRFDLADFATDTHTNRAKVLDQVCSVAGASGVWTWGRVRSEVWTALELPNPLPEHHEAGKILGSYAESAEPGELVAAAIGRAREAYTDANAAQKNTKAKAAGMLEERSGVETLGTLEDARRARDEAQERRNKANEALVTAKSASEAVESHMKRGESLSKELSRAETALEGLDADQVEADRKRGEVGDLEAIKATEAEARKAFKSAEIRFESVDEDFVDATEEASKAKQEAATARGAISVLEGMKTDADAVCQHCGKDDPLDVVHRIELAKIDLDAAVEIEELADDELKILRRRRDRAKGELEAKRAELVTAASASTKSGNLAARVEAEQQRIYKAREAYSKEVAEAEVDLQAWKEEEIPAAPGLNPSGLAAALQAAEEDLARGNDLVEKIVRSEEREAALQQAIADRDAAVERFDFLKKLGGELKRIREAIATAAFEPIENAANGLLDSAEIGLRIKFREASDFGAYRDDAWISFWSLSDSERALVGAAIAYSFATLTGSPWRAVVLDRLEAIDRPRLRRVLTAFAAKVRDGELDNMIGALVADEDAVDPELEGVTVHRLSVSS